MTIFKPSHIFAGLMILLIAVILRFSYPNSLPVFADESIYIRWAQIMRSEATLRFLPLSDGKQPLFMWAAIPFLKIISDPLIAGRTLSAMAGVGTVMGVGVAAFILFKKSRQALLAAALWAALPYAVFFDRMALSDSLLTMFVVWTFNFASLAFIHLRLDLAMFAGFSLGFAWLTKSPAIFSFLLIPALLFLVKLELKYPIRLIKLLGLMLAIYVIAFAMYNILRLGPQFHMIALRNKDYVYPLSEIIRHPLSPLIPHLKDSVIFYLYLATPFGLVLSLWGLVSDKLTHWRQRLILLVWWLVPVFVQSLVAISFTARYLLFTAPFAVVLMSHAAEHIGEKTQRHLLTYAAVLLVIIPSLWFVGRLIVSPGTVPLPRIERAGYLEEWTAGTGIRQVSDLIKNYAANGPVLIGSEGFFGTPFDALGMYLDGVANVRVIGVGVWIDSVSDKLKSALGDNQVFLVVNSSRFHGDPDRLGLKLLASYPKAVSPEGSQEFLLFFAVFPQK
ncbi:hypothetical protein A3C34_00070 [Candidatus Amesbacteria bacterium RIFCSPHIGHO2_02_FULL_48_21]|uniref:Glycosyltransferase RgtA/B/C/D-like domain-containing protein n=4 Tax=Candidatus Amesiibacteriota TaxID=1752730 RepID=A0A0G1UKV1_9BACT|nr:MAG: hypothetical protein UX78_C0020G0019 [Candidatus Amesbacteria bacterium GW2011_GWA2_47_11]KKU94822.1 MAG: hypothetical protein UY22_C0006G0020 [Candidatus Amesbacteria bacterium GW2011_GWC1_48_10]KKW00789.1 MAG: hypothetical protein UY33_C0005G0018 [Candidatus Amesbacteria bacterium GW2011_GWA1_48_9]OGC95608.1 MAG: hypothetical protein A3C34_00070 [Candidatus Amesbacteria bacterium RIFCSPHIGHO2_02_FULL_48_21]OGD07381.1 MAG: hypothetical protein A3B58_02150 [Candidatus Amesbacteria bacte